MLHKTVGIMARHKFFIFGGASAIFAAISLTLFPGQALLSDGSCIRFISIPLVISPIKVPYWYQQAIAGAFLFLTSLTIVFLLMAWRNHRRKETEQASPSS